MTRDPFVVKFYAVYYSPADFPGEWVVRRHEVTGNFTVGDGALWANSYKYKEAVATIPRGLYKLQRHNEHEPQLWEIWV